MKLYEAMQYVHVINQIKEQAVKLVDENKKLQADYNMSLSMINDLLRHAKRRRRG